jgi:TolB protein
MIQKKIFGFYVFLFFIPGIATAQDKQTAALNNLLKQFEVLLQDGGKWKAINKDYKSTEEWSARYFGYEFTKGVSPHTLRIKITGYFPQKSQWLTFWDGFYTWDFKKQKAVYQSVNSEGAIAAGESESIGESEMSLIFSITQPNGKVEKHKDVQKITGSQILSNSFIQKAGKWEAKNNMTWTRLEQPSGFLTFMSTRDGNFEIYSMDAKGDSVKNLSCNKATDYSFGYTPDGKLVFYSNREGNDEVYLQDADGKKVTNLTNNPAADRIAAVSPDGKRIAFSSNRDNKTSELYVMDVDGKNVTRLTNNDNFEDAPYWSPDGTKIIFSKDIKPVNDTAPHVTSNGEIFSMNADGSTVLRLTNRPGFDGGPQFSPDGSKIAFYGKDENGNYEIFIMNADGSNVTNLTEDEMEDYSPSWSPDGKWIAYTKGNSKNYDVWVIHIETKIKYRLTTQPKRDESPFWQPNK